ncbi:DNA-binding transcriptional regulator, AcrR family [Friedmanniella luteola]|uniref:DNA-binding transcriptional regulator, AcrR family n=1 Tax=Friedmanniella luteola TaxID=546871 RepID=A0A1H1ZXY7_9ACTN|nr:TetR/AcrR family transcriptional regulator C-terminal domain-containing protein [Friedmanniella luteola]SDT38671.1 DNA-binding transcriptional regulator, AcrR family [Friedmanniella luteola]
MTPHEPEEPSRPTGTLGPQPPAGPEKAVTPGGRRPLDRSLILREAVRFIDAHGRERLTMRRLGAELGVEAMALYRYVPGRDQLLDGVVETVMDELYGLTMESEQPGTWQEFLQQMARGVRAIAIEHPKIFPLVASRPPAAPWLRPPLRSLRWVEAFLQGLRHYGFSGPGSVEVYRAFSTFLLGHLLLESSTYAAEPELDVTRDVEFVETNDLAAYPLLMELSPQLSLDTFDGEFEGSLEELINRMAVGPR